MVKLELSKEEMEFLTSLVHAGVQAGGMNAVRAASKVLDVFDRAKIEEGDKETGQEVG